jgi:hypothetical protein
MCRLPIPKFMLCRKHRVRGWLLWLLAAALAAAVCLSLCLTEPHASEKQQSRRKRPALIVSFRGYTNAQGGQAIAILSMTNCDTCDLCLWGPSALEFSKQPNTSLEPTFRSWPGSALPRGSSYTAAIEIPAGSGTWKLSFFVQRWRLRDRVERILGDRTPWKVDNDIQYFETDWIQR